MKYIDPLKTSLVFAALTVLLSGCFHGGSSDHSATTDELVTTEPQSSSTPEPTTTTPDTETPSTETPDTEASNTDATQTDTPATAEPKIITLDATAGGLGTTASDPKNKFTYFNVESGKVVELTDAEAESSSSWHIAFKRTSVKTNSGISGPAGVKAGVADSQASFYDDAGQPVASLFLNATADSELAAFDTIVTIDDVVMMTDKAQPIISGGGGDTSWFSYNAMTHQLTAKPDNWWLLRGADGLTYAKFHTLSIDHKSYAFEFEFQLTDPTTAQFDTAPTVWSTTIANGQGSTCFDIDTASEVDCTNNSTSWDLMLELAGRSWNLWTNGGIQGAGKGAAFGPFDTATADSYITGTQSPGGEPITSHYSADKKGGIFSEQSWYAYAVTQQPADHGIYPNFRVYVLDAGEKQYKVQLLDYYDASGLSGYITLRYQPL